MITAFKGFVIGNVADTIIKIVSTTVKKLPQTGQPLDEKVIIAIGLILQGSIFLILAFENIFQCLISLFCKLRK